MKKRLLSILILAVLSLGLCACAQPAAPSEEPSTPSDSWREVSLEGKTIVWVGSSLTYGYANNGISMVDYLEETTHCICAKYAVSGTTLVDKDEESYISRLKKIPSDQKCDYFICQLSTNDATQQLPIGDISDSFDIDSFDTQTVCGAIEYVIAYAKERFDCPIAFYTAPRYWSSPYKKMAAKMLLIKEKWGIELLDLWNNEELMVMSEEDRTAFLKHYMADSVHPNELGYKEWLTPIFEEFFKSTIEK